MGFGLNSSVISRLEHTVPGFQTTPRPGEERERMALEINHGEDACSCQVTRCGRENIRGQAEESEGHATPQPLMPAAHPVCHACSRRGQGMVGLLLPASTEMS